MPAHIAGNPLYWITQRALIVFVHFNNGWNMQNNNWNIMTFWIFLWILYLCETLMTLHEDLTSLSWQQSRWEHMDVTTSTKLIVCCWWKWATPQLVTIILGLVSLSLVGSQLWGNECYSVIYEKQGICRKHLSKLVGVIAKANSHSARCNYHSATSLETTIQSFWVVWSTNSRHCHN